MSQPAVDNLHTDTPGLPWAEQDARDRRSRLTELLARVSREANEGEDLEAVLRRIVDCLVETSLFLVITSLPLERTYYGRS